MTENGKKNIDRQDDEDESNLLDDSMGKRQTHVWVWGLVAIGIIIALFFAQSLKTTSDQIYTETSRPGGGVLAYLIGNVASGTANFFAQLIVLSIVFLAIALLIKSIWKITRETITTQDNESEPRHSLPVHIFRVIDNFIVKSSKPSGINIILGGVSFLIGIFVFFIMLKVIFFILWLGGSYNESIFWILMVLTTIFFGWVQTKMKAPFMMWVISVFEKFVNK